VLAFFAFIGFEDIVNMAEEVKRPEKTLPRAILLSLVITSAIYAVVAYAAVRAVPLADLAVSQQPLLLVWHQGGTSDAATPAVFLSVIAVAAALNGVLAQIVMAARVMFGIGRRMPALAVFHRTSARFGTPTLATLLIGALVTTAALMLPVSSLAEGASTLLLSIFVIVNLALISMKHKQPEAPFRVPMVVPVLGLLAALGALAVNFGLLALIAGGAA
jgi:amino acid transporter